MNRKLKIWPALTILLLIIVLISIPLYLIGFKLLLAEHPRSSTIAASSLMADKELTDKESQGLQSIPAVAGCTHDLAKLLELKMEEPQLPIKSKHKFKQAEGHSSFMITQRS
jgi:hypothetical protein